VVGHRHGRRTASALRRLSGLREEVGLLTPSGRTEGGFRLCTDDVEKILVIRRLKPLGSSIEEMKAVMTDIELLRDAGRPTAPRSQR
jgi:MerR family copper efflux transcriptional regulator